MVKEMRVFSGKGLILLFTVIILVAASVAWKLGSNSGQFNPIPSDIEDYLFWEAKELKPFHLTDAEHGSFGLENLKGKWSFVFFGYTHCPDVCPATLSMLDVAFNILKRHNPDIFQEMQGIFVSVDPKRDTPAALKEYVSYFHTGFIGVTGTPDQINALAHQIGVLYTIDDEESKGSDYEVVHNSTIFLVDPEGRLYGRFSPPQNPEVIAKTFRKIRAFYHEQKGNRQPVS